MTTFESAVPTAFVHDTIAELATFKTQFDVFRLMKRIIEACGSRAFMVLNIPSATSLDLSSNSIITNWPADLLSSYDKVALLAESLSSSVCGPRQHPFQYNVSVGTYQRADRTESPARSLFERFNLPRGCLFPGARCLRHRGAVSFSGDREPFTFMEMMQLSFLSNHVYNRLAEIRDLDNKATDTLTEREIDCLNWTAAGKTSVEIAEILGLSEHTTINHYLNRAPKSWIRSIVPRLWPRPCASG